MNYGLIALGNPGDKYKVTRHNIAWIVIDALFADNDWEHNKYADADMTSWQSGENEVLIAKPHTFMNLSGKTAVFMRDQYMISPENFIIVHDDLDIPFGSLKISFDRGDAGHNGIKSIINHFGSKSFIRIRIGLAQTAPDGRTIKPPVLGEFSSDEKDALPQLSSTIGKALQRIVARGVHEAMNEYNRK